MKTDVTTAKNLVKAMFNIQHEIKAAHKSSVNPHFKSKFADLTEVWDTCRGALQRHGVAVIQVPLFEGTAMWLETSLIHVESGESLVGHFLLKPTKEDMQGMGSAITYARRYALTAMLGVMTDDDDGNAASQARPQAPVATKASTGFDPKNPEHVKTVDAAIKGKVTSPLWRAHILNAMTGRSLVDLPQVIKQCNPEAPDAPKE